LAFIFVVFCFAVGCMHHAVVFCDVLYYFIDKHQHEKQDLMNRTSAVCHLHNVESFTIIIDIESWSWQWKANSV